MTDWVQDIADMQDKFQVREWVWNNREDKEKLRKFVEFRINFLQEELDETRKAFEAGDAEEIIDGLVDLCVVAIGTMDAFGVDSHESWNRVYQANMAKEIGVKESRPNPLGLPDLIKPEGWTAPSHAGNHGSLGKLFNDEVI